MSEREIPHHEEQDTEIPERILPGMTPAEIKMKRDWAEKVPTVEDAVHLFQRLDEDIQLVPLLRVEEGEDPEEVAKKSVNITRETVRDNFSKLSDDHKRAIYDILERKFLLQPPKNPTEARRHLKHVSRSHPYGVFVEPTGSSETLSGPPVDTSYGRKTSRHMPNIAELEYQGDVIESTYGRRRPPED